MIAGTTMAGARSVGGIIGADTSIPVKVKSPEPPVPGFFHEGKPTRGQRSAKTQRPQTGSIWVQIC